MASTVISAKQTPKLNYLNNGHSLKSWLLTTDHKRIALLYLISVTAFFFSVVSLPCSFGSNCSLRRAT